MDLRTQAPRSPREQHGGYVHLGRMIDKCRAVLAGIEGEYIYPCPMDQRLLEFARLTDEQFTQAVRNGSDTEVVSWFLATSAPHTREEIEAWNEMFLTREPDTEEKWAYFRQLRDAVNSSRTDIRSWADLLDLDEGRSVPLRKQPGHAASAPRS